MGDKLDADMARAHGDFPDAPHHGQRIPDPTDSASYAAKEAAGAILALLVASRRRSRTVQLMPDDHGPGLRFEIIKVSSGDYEAIAHVGGDGKVWLVGEPAAPEPGEAPRIGP